MEHHRPQEPVFVAFLGTDLIQRGALRDVVSLAKERYETGTRARIAFFDDESGSALDVALEGSKAEVLARLAAHPALAEGGRRAQTPRRGPGRPKLGVVSREVTLLPRHWAWLGQQRGGASATLRRLVDAARKANAPAEGVQRAVEAAHRFLWDIAGDQPGFEEATRALFAHDFEAFDRQIAAWPKGLQEQLERFLRPARQ